ncbi:uncharacterized protein LOC121868284 [Homarus americanus]|uniref:uncharacterized protein LOC121868284 n=1 Tax=Homarus americanus TaxID=6706 RepID=UPI001C44A493|nr:uncharacterized protein LOC121868284 [Homarus americanus]
MQEMMTTSSYGDVTCCTRKSVGSGPCQGEVCTLLYHTSCLTCTAVPGFSPPISGLQVIHNTTKGSRCQDTAQTQPSTPPLYLRNVVLNTGVPCCPRLCLLATTLYLLAAALCLLAAALDCSALCAAPLDGSALCAAPLDGSALCAAPLDGSALCAAPLDGSALCMPLSWTALLCACRSP